MSLDLPKLFFRTRENGAAVFRVDTSNRQHRIDLYQIALAHVPKNEIRPHGDAVLTDDERAEIQSWINDRTDTLIQREVDDIFRAIDHLNSVTHWAQTKASDVQLQAFTDQLLLAMHDLRSVLIRKKADRLIKDRGD
ncbi:MAG: hypothetical protein AAF701_01910 [Pseudomonadota bacterium]